MQDSEFIISQF